MSLLIDSTAPIGAEDVLSFVQEQPIPSNNMLTQLFPREDQDTDSIDLSTLTVTNRTLQFRNWDGSFAPVARDTAKVGRVKLIPMGGFREEGEWERRQIEHLATAGTNIARLQTAIYNDLEQLTAYAYNRLELAWGDVLTDGVLTLNENGVVQTLDFGVPSGNITTPSGALWSNHSSSVPLTDMLAWRDAWVAINGTLPGRILTSMEVASDLMQNTQLINAIKGAQTGATYVSLPEINAFIAGFGLPPIEMPNPGMTGGSIYNSNFDVDGTSTRVLAANKFLFLPADPGEVGFTAWGVPTTVYELNAKNVQVNMAQGIVGMLIREDNPPFTKHAYVDAVVMPVIKDGRKLFVATVR
ncbi:major capsid protein E [Mycobacterium sp. BK086]|uniref:major capsid protein n=1 Tax=Mycobacterium sp. BK086 TaxID=2512165 RepID=UPI00105FF048|nr:major capsid protein [Mycobacterium sp. BK086]TDO18139.1 major capsid protein E [Mycobacterium sp. BK086]